MIFYLLDLQFSAHELCTSLCVMVFFPLIGILWDPFFHGGKILRVGVTLTAGFQILLFLKESHVLSMLSTVWNSAVCIVCMCPVICHCSRKHRSCDYKIQNKSALIKLTVFKFRMSKLIIQIIHRGFNIRAFDNSGEKFMLIVHSVS